MFAEWDLHGTFFAHNVIFAGWDMDDASLAQHIIMAIWDPDEDLDDLDRDLWNV